MPATKGTTAATRTTNVKDSAAKKLSQIFKKAKPASGTYSISPSIAKQILAECNTRNRKLLSHRVARLAAEIKAGSWKFNGETIKFSSTGRLLDGQHRLAACVAAGMTMKTAVVFDLEDDTFDTIDVGAKRAASQALTLAGYKSTIVLAGAVRAVDCFRTSCLSEVRHHPCSNARILKLTKANPRIMDAVSAIQSQPLIPLVHLHPPTLLATMYYLTSQQDATLAFRTFEKLAQGIDMTRGDPTRLLLNVIQADSRKPTPERRARGQQYAIWIEAWNAIKAGEQPSRLEYTRDKYYADYEFPDIGKVPL